MGKKLYWKFDEKTKIVKLEKMASKDTDAAEKYVEEQYTFRLTRYKDNNNKKESLKIESLFNGKPNGELYTHIYDLDKDMKGLMEYGVAFSDVMFIELRMEIQNAYLYLNVEPIEEIKGIEGIEGSQKLKNFFDAIGEYLACDVDLIDNEYCYIPVNDFNYLADDCGYTKFELIGLKKYLSEKHIRSTPGRLAILVRLKGKPTRVLAFKKNTIQEYIKKYAPKMNVSGDKVIEQVSK